MTTRDQGGDKPNVKADGTPYPEETAEARCVLEPYAHVSCWHPDSDPTGVREAVLEVLERFSDEVA